MIPASFAYTRAATLDEAVAAVGAGAKIIAGGQSLLPLLKLRLAHADRLVDIGRLAELKGVRQLDDGRIGVGSLTTYHELMDSPAMHYGVLKDALPGIGDLQVRNRGTVGGAIAHADPASDLPACLLALDAEIVARSSRGERSIQATEFFQGAFEPALTDDEVLTEIRLPAPLDGAGSAYASLEQTASGYALVGVAAVVVRATAGGPISFATVAVTGVHEHAYRASEVEEALVGSDGSSGAIEAAVAHATDEVEVNADIHADAAYRTAMAAVYARRAIEAALARIG